MRKINLTDYEFAGTPFNIRPSIATVLFLEPKLEGREIIRRDELAQRVETCQEDFILLEEADYERILKGLKATDLSPFGRSVVEFVKRILDAPVVDVQEKS